jgi:hypothetical protein
MRQPIYVVGQPHGILRVFNTILYENEFQNPHIFQQTISPFPKHSTLSTTIHLLFTIYITIHTLLYTLFASLQPIRIYFKWTLYTVCALL